MANLYWPPITPPMNLKKKLTFNSFVNYIQWNWFTYKKGHKDNISMGKDFPFQICQIF